MITIGIETVEQPCSVGILSSDNKFRKEKIIKEVRGVSEYIAKYFKDLFREVDLAPDQIDCVSVCLGPGSFTGIRAGIAFAKAFCQFSNIKLIGLSAFEVLRYKALKAHLRDRLIVPLIDAGNMRCYLEIDNVKQVLSIQDIMKNVGSKKDVLFIGSGASVYKDEILRNYSKDSLFTESNEISSLDICELGIKKFKQKQFSDVYSIDGLYVLPPNITKSKK